MKNILSLIIISGLLMAASCGKEPPPPIDTAAINLSFRATYGDETLVLNQQNYDYEGKAVRFSKVNFYLANLAAVNDDGETELSEIRFIDLTLTHNTAIDAAKGTVISFSRVPVGTYKFLKFGIGVPADLNKTNPSDYSTSHPLGADNSGEYWEAWNSYIFAKIEGQYDEDGSGDFDGNDISFAYHTGIDRVYQEIELDNNLNLVAGETTNLDFELDIRQLFTRPAGSLIPLEPHDPNDQIGEMIIIMENFKRALQLK